MAQAKAKIWHWLAYCVQACSAREGAGADLGRRDCRRRSTHPPGIDWLIVDIDWLIVGIDWLIVYIDWLTGIDWLIVYIDWLTGVDWRVVSKLARPAEEREPTWLDVIVEGVVPTPQALTGLLLALTGLLLASAGLLLALTGLSFTLTGLLAMTGLLLALTGVLFPSLLGPRRTGSRRGSTSLSKAWYPPPRERPFRTILYTP